MNNIFYIYPEVEGNQHYVCWGFKKDKLSNKSKEDIKSKVLDSLKQIAKTQYSWISKRSFSIFVGEDVKFFWIAVPRQLPTKSIKIINNKLKEFNISPKIVITSMENPFGNTIPFEPVISYDRGFIVDSTKINENIATSSLNTEKIIL